MMKDGGKRTRTAGPYNAIVVLYQLSYTPAQGFLLFPIFPSLVKSLGQQRLKIRVHLTLEVSISTH